MIFVPATSLKPSRAALPVSPLVAVRMRISRSSFSCFLAAVSKYGNKDNARSLKANVRPWNNSAMDKSVSMEWSGTMRSSRKVVSL